MGHSWTRTAVASVETSVVFLSRGGRRAGRPRTRWPAVAGQELQSPDGRPGAQVSRRSLDRSRRRAVLPLPPSQQDPRAARLSRAERRRFRREHLCELLWEIPDDPRGSLRWSLSKLRRLVDDETRARIIADRTTVALRRRGRRDRRRSRSRPLAPASSTRCRLEELEDAAARYGGNFLEGLEFSTSTTTTRGASPSASSAARAAVRLLNALLTRLAGEPQRAVEHARALVRHRALRREARAALIRLLMPLGQPDEAEQQYQLGSRMLKEAGVAPTGALLRAGAAPGAAAERRAPPSPARRRTAATAVASVSAQRSDRRRETQLVGRDAELARLRAAESRTRSSSAAAGVVLVRGEPGIGKSRLLERAAALARESGAVRAARQRPSKPKSIRPFALWIDALRKLDPTRHGASSAAIREFENRDRLSRASQRSHRRARAALQPVVLIFDDAAVVRRVERGRVCTTWRARARRRVLGLLAARRASCTTTCRCSSALRELRHAGLLEELEVGPLGEDAMLAASSARARRGADAERLCNECGGNPLLAIELARAERPASSGGSLDELVQRTPRALRRRRRRSAALGRRAERRASSGDAREAHGPRCWNASARRSKTPSASRSCAGRARPALLARAGRARRLHRHLARAPAHDAPPRRRAAGAGHGPRLARAADLAHHATQSGDAGLAARAMVSAGRLCLRFFANDEALSLARRGLQLASSSCRPRSRSASSSTCTTSCSRRRRRDDWEDAPRASTRRSPSGRSTTARSPTRGSATTWPATCTGRTATGPMRASRSLQSERVVRGGDDEEHIVGMAETARCLVMLERDLTQADAMLMEARALAERNGIAPRDPRRARHAALSREQARRGGGAVPGGAHAVQVGAATASTSSRPTSIS